MRLGALAMLLAAAFAIWASAVPAPYDPCYHYPKIGLTVCLRSSRQVQSECLDAGSTWDDGSPMLSGQQAAGCYDPATRTITVRDDADGAEVLVHELCHFDGTLSDRECDKVQWHGR